jgi:NADPH:quinone reductase-like Zn-dependent oxidoreductase
MRAVVRSQYGPPEVLRLADVRKPRPEDDELLIRVHATTVNRTDCAFLRGEPPIVRVFSGLTKPKRLILGSEFAGDVEAVGKDVTSFEIGQRVFGFDGAKFGAHSEYMTTSEDGLVATIPPAMTYEEAVPSTEGAHYALGFIHAAKIKLGQKVLVNGATGAIGSAAVQLLKYYGAEVTAVCDTPNIPLVKSLGADHVIDYTQEDFTRSGGTFDVVFDAVGKSSFASCRPLLKAGGQYLSSDLGRRGENPVLAVVTPVFRKKKVVFPFPRDGNDDILLIRTLLERGTFRPVVDKTYPLEEIRQAFEYVESGMKTGSVIIHVADAREG